jgi:hypothetical protein
MIWLYGCLPPKNIGHWRPCPLEVLQIFPVRPPSFSRLVFVSLFLVAIPSKDFLSLWLNFYVCREMDIVHLDEPTDD